MEGDNLNDDTALMEAVEKRDLFTMKSLIDDHKRRNQTTLILDAENYDTDDIVKRCFGQDLLDVAVREDMVKAIKVLLYRNEDVTPLMEAAVRAEVEVMKLFIDSNLKFECVLFGYITLLTEFFEEKKERGLKIGNDDIPVVQLLLENGIDVSPYYAGSTPPLVTAIEAGSLGLVQLMCKFDAHDSINWRSGDWTRLKLLKVACETGRADILQFLLQKIAPQNRSGNVPKIPDGHETTHLCLKKGHAECAEIILNHGLKNDISGAVKYAVHCNVPLYLKFFLERCPSKVRSNHKRVPRLISASVIEAVKKDYTDIIKVLLEAKVSLPGNLNLIHARSPTMVQLLVTNGANVNRKPRRGNPVLLTLIRSCENVASIAEMVKILLEKGAEVNASNSEGLTPLIAASQTCTHSDLPIILLRYGANVNAKDQSGYTALLYAVEKNCTETAKVLIEKTDIDMQTISESTALISAVKHCNKTISDLLIDKGANVNVENRNGETALTWAVRKLCPDTVRKIIEAGAHINHQNKKGYSALMFAASRFPVPVPSASASLIEDESTLIDLLISKGANVNLKNSNGDTALTLAAGQCKATTVRKLIEEGACVDHQNKVGCSALILCAASEASSEESKKVLIDLLISRGADVSLVDNNGDTALTWAAKKCDLDTVRTLTEAGAEVNHQNKEGYSALIFATSGAYSKESKKALIDLLLSRGAYSKESKKALIDLLVSRGADVSLVDKNRDTALTWAAKKCDVDTVRTLIEAKAEVNHQNKEGYSALMCATYRASSKESKKALIDLLISRGADVSLVDNKNGDTALTFATKNRDVDTIRKLLEAEAEVSHQNKEGYSALMLAADTRSDVIDLDILNILLLHGADVNAKNNMGNTALLLAIENRCTEKSKLLIQHAGDRKVDIDAQNTSGLNALISAVKRRCKEIADLLIDLGANVNMEDNSGDTTLTWAAKENDEITLKKLLERGADINYRQSKEGYSALMFAAETNSKGSMGVLLNAGADVNAVSRGREKKSALSLLFELRDSYEYLEPESKEYSLMIDLLDRGASSSFLKSKALFEIIQFGPFELVQKLISGGLGPDEISSDLYFDRPLQPEILAFSKISPFLFALVKGYSEHARFFNDNWFLCASDIQLPSKHQSVKQILETKSNNKCEDIFDEFCSQPMSLLKLSFVTVSSAIGCLPGREDRVKQLPLPDLVKEKLLFKRQEVHSDDIQHQQGHHYFDSDSSSD